MAWMKRATRVATTKTRANAWRRRRMVYATMGSSCQATSLRRISRRPLLLPPGRLQSHRRLETGASRQVLVPLNLFLQPFPLLSPRQEIPGRNLKQPLFKLQVDRLARGFVLGSAPPHQQTIDVLVG